MLKIQTLKTQNKAKGRRAEHPAHRRKTGSKRERMAVSGR